MLKSAAKPTVDLDSTFSPQTPDKPKSRGFSRELRKVDSGIRSHSLGLNFSDNTVSVCPRCDVRPTPATTTLRPFCRGRLVRVCVSLPNHLISRRRLSQVGAGPVRREIGVAGNWSGPARLGYSATRRKKGGCILGVPRFRSLSNAVPAGGTCRPPEIPICRAKVRSGGYGRWFSAELRPGLPAGTLACRLFFVQSIDAKSKDGIYLRT